MGDDSRFQELLHVLTKLEASKRHCEIDIAFDGNRFRWSVKIGGLRAHEFTLAAQHPPRGKSELTSEH